MNSVMADLTRRAKVKNSIVHLKDLLQITAKEAPPPLTLASAVHNFFHHI